MKNIFKKKFKSKMKLRMSGENKKNKEMLKNYNSEKI